jgi:superfamily I DNA/RNA helicase
MVKRKDDFSAGLETILNNPQTSFITNPKTFREIHSQSGMPLTAMIRHIGKQSGKKKEYKPTDDEKSKARLDTLEAKSEK